MPRAETVIRDLSEPADDFLRRFDVVTEGVGLPSPWPDGRVRLCRSGGSWGPGDGRSFPEAVAAVVREHFEMLEREESLGHVGAVDRAVD